MNAPALESIGGNLYASGVKNLNLPRLKTVGGNFVINGTGLKHMPPLLEHIGGNAIVSSEEPESLINELQILKEKGILKGEIIRDGKIINRSAKKPWWKIW